MKNNAFKRTSKEASVGRFAGPAALGLALLGLGCGDNQDPAGAQELFDRINALDYRNSFDKAPGFEQRQPSNTAHSDFSAIYINEVVADVLADGTPLTEWPLDSLIIKDCLLYTSPSPRDLSTSRMPSSA